MQKNLICIFVIPTQTLLDQISALASFWMGEYGTKRWGVSFTHSGACYYSKLLLWDFLDVEFGTTVLP